MKDEIQRELESLKKQYGSPSRGRGCRYPDIFKRRIAQLTERGLSPSELSRATGISVATLQSWRKKLSGKNFKRVDIAGLCPPPKFRIFLGEQIWLELEEERLTPAFLQKLRAVL